MGCHGVSLLRWRSGGSNTPTIRRPYPFMPSPTFAHSSRYLSMLRFHPECFGHPDQIGHRSRSHFLHKMTAMHLHGDLAEADFGCDLFAHQPARHQSHDFALARGERCEMRLQVRDPILMFTPFLITLDRSRNGIQKILIAKRLGEEIDSAGLHGPHRHGNIAMSRNEHDRNANIRLRQLGLEVETAQSRQPDVEYKAAWNIRTLALQELLRRCEYLDPQLYRLKEPRKRLTHRGVVVHDEDDRLVRAPNGLR